MNKEYLRSLLEEVKSGRAGVDEVLRKLEDFGSKAFEFATIDTHRELRTGYPEVVFGKGKTSEQVVEIVRYMLSQGNNILITRVSGEMVDRVKAIYAKAVYNPMARTLAIMKNKPDKPSTYIAVVTAGTSDMPVAEEAVVTAEIFGNTVKRVVDVGVAGIHRLFEKLDVIRGARVCVVVAGMEGALPSVVGGLVDKPVIAVPTSVGYGASFGGLSALLGMLTSCASGTSVVNIDNGFGAGYLASMINKL